MGVQDGQCGQRAGCSRSGQPTRCPGVGTGQRRAPYRFPCLEGVLQESDEALISQYRSRSLLCELGSLTLTSGAVPRPIGCEATVLLFDEAGSRAWGVLAKV